MCKLPRTRLIPVFAKQRKPLTTTIKERSMPPVPVKRVCAMSLSVSVLFLMGCATKTPMPPADLPQLPPPPSLSMPLPSTPYSTTAAQRMEIWQKKLQGTQMMRKP